MTPSPQSSVNSVPVPVPAAPHRVLVPVPPEPESVPSATIHAPPPFLYRSGREIVLEYGAEPPTEHCIRCGRPATLEKRYSLRNSRDFRTWFGGRPDLALGLCRKHSEDHSVAVALTWSTLAVGAMLVTVGLLTLSVLSIALGLVAMAGSGFFRASSPVSAPEVTESRILLVGSAEVYLKHLPNRPEIEDPARALPLVP